MIVELLNQVTLEECEKELKTQVTELITWHLKSV